MEGHGTYTTIHTVPMKVISEFFFNKSTIVSKSKEYPCKRNENKKCFE